MEARPRTPPPASVRRRVVLVALYTVACFATAGLVFGYAAIKPVLASEGVYVEACGGNGTATPPFGLAVDICPAQSLQLDVMFIVGSTMSNAVSLLSGWLLDAKGPRVTAVAAYALVTLGLILAGVAERTNDALYAVGFGVIAVGSSTGYMATVHLSNLFAKYAGTIITMLNGAYDASSLIFYLFQVIYRSTGYAATPFILFLSYATIPAALAMLSLVLMPRWPFARSDAAADLTSPAEDPKHALGVRLRHLRHDPLKKQLRSLAFWLFTPTVMMYMLRINFFISSLDQQLRPVATSEQVASITALFSLVLPLAGVGAIPFVGLLLDRCHLSTTFFVVNGLGLLFGIISLIPALAAHYVTIVLVVLLRPLFYSVVSDYAARVFGFNSFGVIFGLSMTLAALFSTFQYLLNFLALDVSDGNYLYVNLGLLILCVPLLALPIYIMPDRGRGVAWLRRVTGASTRGLLGRDHEHEHEHDHEHEHEHDHDHEHDGAVELLPVRT